MDSRIRGGLVAAARMDDERQEKGNEMSELAFYSVLFAVSMTTLFGSWLTWGPQLHSWWTGRANRRRARERLKRDRMTRKAQTLHRY